MPDPGAVAYLAWLIDGEGCIMMRRDCRRADYCYYLVLIVTNEHKGALDWCMGLYGGTLYKQPRARADHKQIYYWETRSKTAHMILVEVLPYLKIKREQAQLVIDHWESIKPGLVRDVATTDLAKKRFLVWQGLRELKKKAYVEG